MEEALEHLATIHPIELCHEAKVEYCRATRDFTSCGRYVDCVLSSCGHASLCAECSQRYDVCPICRTTIVAEKDGRRRLRLFNKCVSAGLISKRHDDRFIDKKQNNKYALADIQRLYHLFDVALENNLVSLVCHYVTDVCMDECAVSSDPMLALFLDEKVVRDWCLQKFEKILSELGKIYALKVDLNIELTSISKFGFLLTSLSNVLDVLVLSSPHASPEQSEDLRRLLDNMMKAKQHLEVMVWCIKHNFLENVKKQYPSIISWRTQVQQRKSAAVGRAWADTRNSLEYDGSTLFIEDALANLSIEMHQEKRPGDLDIASLEEDHNTSLVSISNSCGLLELYPFESLRAATDILFLRGTSETVIAKQAILLYYLFDRHWTADKVEWWHVIDDFAATFGITRYSVLESLVFYLLDDISEQSLQEAARLLPEIAGPETHPKIIQVLLQCQKPDIALMVLHSSGKDWFSGQIYSKNENMHLVTLGEAVTAIRVRVEYGLLTAAFMYLRMYCTCAKQGKMKFLSNITSANSCKTDGCSWIDWVEVLVDELCSLCIRRNIVDRMLDLPWDANEEKYLCRCLYNDACQNPSSTSGSFLVSFLLQRHRYIEAYRFDRKVREVEDNFSGSPEEVSRIRLTSQWRGGLVDRGVELLPEIQRVQLKAKDDDADLFSSTIADTPSKNSSLNSKPSGYCSKAISLPLERPLILQPDPSSLLRQQSHTKFLSATASPTRTSGNFCSPATPSPVRERVLDSHGSPTLDSNASPSMNGDRWCNGDYSASNSIFSRVEFPSETRKMLPRRKRASFGKQTVSTSNDVNMFFTRSFSAKVAPQLEPNTTGMRWRTDESSEEEMDMDDGRHLVALEDSMRSQKHR